EARDVAFEVPEEPAEEIDLLLRLAAVLPGEHPACRDPDQVEVERVGSYGREELVVLSLRREVSDRLIARDRRRVVHPVRERLLRPTEQVGGRRIEDAER